jgi:hypothetical protein
MLGTFIGWLGAFSDFIEHHIGAITAIIAGAAVIQWRETRKTAERQLRAYVLNFSTTIFDGGSMNPKPFVDRAGQPGTVVEIKNFGQTPALEVVHWSEIEVAPVSREQYIKAPETLTKISTSVIGPGHTSNNSRWLNRALSTQEIDGIKNGTFAIYVYGRIEYVDAFKAKRWSTYKMRYTNAAWPPIGNGGTTNFCSDGNQAN